MCKEVVVSLHKADLLLQRLARKNAVALSELLSSGRELMLGPPITEEGCQLNSLRVVQGRHRPR
jgi:hypothetical protein